MKASLCAGDNAPLAVIAFVERDVNAKGAADHARNEANKSEEASAA